MGKIEHVGWTIKRGGMPGDGAIEADLGNGRAGPLVRTLLEMLASKGDPDVVAYITPDAIKEAARPRTSGQRRLRP